MSGVVHNLFYGDFRDHAIPLPKTPLVLYPCVLDRTGGAIVRIGYVFSSEDEKKSYMASVGYSKMGDQEYWKYGLPIEKCKIEKEPIDTDSDQSKKDNSNPGKDVKKEKIRLEVKIYFTSIPIMCIVMGQCGFEALPQDNRLYWGHADGNQKTEYRTVSYSKEDSWATTEKIILDMERDGWTRLDSFNDYSGKLLLFSKRK